VLYLAAFEPGFNLSSKNWNRNVAALPVVKKRMISKGDKNGLGVL